MTIYTGEFKVIEKTWPVNIGEAERGMIQKIQGLTKERIGFEITQRAVVTRAIQHLYETLFPSEAGTPT